MLIEIVSEGRLRVARAVHRRAQPCRLTARTRRLRGRCRSRFAACPRSGSSWDWRMAGRQWETSRGVLPVVSSSAMASPSPVAENTMPPPVVRMPAQDGNASLYHRYAFGNRSAFTCSLRIASAISSIDRRGARRTVCENHTASSQRRSFTGHRFRSSHSARAFAGKSRL